jgi:hypothetical protein
LAVDGIKDGLAEGKEVEMISAVVEAIEVARMSVFDICLSPPRYL